MTNFYEAIGLKAGSSKAPTILTEYDVKTMIDATHKPYYKLFLILGLNTGMSMNEMFDIKFKDIEMSGKIMLPTRTVMVPTETMELLKPYYNMSNMNPNDYLFPMSEYDINNYIKYWNKIIKKKFGLTKKKFGWFDIRHTYAYTAAKMNVPIQLAANNIGTDIANLKKYYTAPENNGHKPEALFS